MANVPVVKGTPLTRRDLLTVTISVLLSGIGYRQSQQNVEEIQRLREEIQALRRELADQRNRGDTPPSPRGH